MKMKNNQKKALKRKLRNKELIERRRDEELYALSKIDKNTWEGQTRLPIEDIYKKEDSPNWSLFSILGWK